MKSVSWSSMHRLGAACCFVLVLTVQARAQQPRTPPPDTVVSLNALVITAERVQTPLAASVAAVSRINATQLARIPQVTLADALRNVPGFSLISFDGLGYEPQLMTRGFYGGGEAEYVVVLVDGKPVNNLQGGQIAWDALPLGAAESIEVVRGGSSALYGDAALAGIINIRTAAGQPPGANAGVGFGTFETWRAQADAHGMLFGQTFDLFAGSEMTGGFREHSERTAVRAGGRLPLLMRDRDALTLSAGAHWRDYDEPGALLDALLDDDRAASDAFFRFDHTKDQNYRVSLDGEHTVGAANRFVASLSGEHRSTEAVRTLALTPQFADTKERELSAQRLLATTQLSLQDTPLPWQDRLILGIDASYGLLDSKYYNVLNGSRAEYASGNGARGDLDTSGEGSRAAFAAFANYSINPVEAVRLSLGVRADWLRDTFEPSTPAGAQTRTTHDAISPKAGVNVQYARNDTHTGHIYATAGRSFKAPTLDQLFDQRRIPIPFPPFAATTSNSELAPQYGDNIELGMYHSTVLAPGSLSADLSLSAYQMKMKDELDFDVASFKYINIGRSKHRGIEAGLRLNNTQRYAAFLNYTLQRVTAEAGDNAGNYLKAIPRTTLSGGLSVTPLAQLEASVFASHNRDMFVDDANTIELPDYTRVDTRLSYSLSRVRVYLDVRNLFDAEYNSSGFLDPSGSGAIYYYPAAGRAFEIGVRTMR